MTSETSEVDQSQTLEDAKEVFVDIATYEEMREEHSLVAEYCDEGILGSIVDLAWRFQFTEDRHSFKKGMQAIQKQVAGKAQLSTEETS